MENKIWILKIGYRFLSLSSVNNLGLILRNVYNRKRLLVRDVIKAPSYETGSGPGQAAASGVQIIPQLAAS